MAYGSPASGPCKVVVVDADPVQRRTLAGLIADGAGGRFSAAAFASRAEADAAIGGGAAIVVADLDTVGGPGHLADVTSLPLIVTSANSSITTAVAAVRGGALDFLPKPVGAKALIERLEAALKAQPTRPAAPVAPAPVTPRTDFAGFIGRSPAMLSVYDQVQRMAPSRAPVFITGESGTGKEVTAEAIHAFSAAKDGSFVAMNCSAIPKDLMESEIFGHVRGAFTGAADNRIGAAERAHGGTLFLDEIAEMELALQAKLLRFIQSGTVQRVGGSEPKPVDVRIVCATNRDPLTEVAAGRFRADLYYRLHVLPIHLQPLRDRREDIMPLAQAYLTRYASEEGRAFAGFATDAVVALSAYDWPGNVRQLANVIRQIVVLNDAPLVTAAMLPTAIVAGGVWRPPAQVAQHTVLPLWQEERRAIEAALAACGGNIARAAAALEISPSTIYRKQQAWEGRRAS